MYTHHSIWHAFHQDKCKRNYDGHIVRHIENGFALQNNSRKYGEPSMRMKFHGWITRTGYLSKNTSTLLRETLTYICFVSVCTKVYRDKY